MALFGICWIADIDSIDEFTDGFRKLLKPLRTRNDAMNNQNTFSSVSDDQSLTEIWDSSKK